MSRYRVLALTSLSLLALIMLGTGAGPLSDESKPSASDVAVLEKQIAGCRDEVSRLQSQLNAYKETRTGTDLMRALIAESQVWTGTVAQRGDYRDGVRIDCHFDTADFKSRLKIRLSENPGDLTVGDVIRVRGRVKNISTSHSSKWYIIDIENATLLEKSRPGPIDSESDQASSK